MTVKAIDERASALPATEQIQNLGAFVRPDELAGVLRVSVQAVRARIRAGNLEATRWGRSWRIPREAALKAISEGVC